MAHEEMSRRGALVVKILSMGGRGGVALTEEEDETSKEKKDDRAEKDEVNYMTAPAKCRDCQYFEAPSSCEKVAGAISKMGYCKLFETKADEEDDAE